MIPVDPTRVVPEPNSAVCGQKMRIFVAVGWQYQVELGTQSVGSEGPCEWRGSDTASGSSRRWPAPFEISNQTRLVGLPVVGSGYLPADVMREFERIFRASSAQLARKPPVEGAVWIQHHQGGWRDEPDLLECAAFGLIQVSLEIFFGLLRAGSTKPR